MRLTRRSYELWKGGVALVHAWRLQGAMTTE